MGKWSMGKLGAAVWEISRGPPSVVWKMAEQKDPWMGQMSVEMKD